MARLIALLAMAGCSPGLQQLPPGVVSEAGWRDITPHDLVAHKPLPSAADKTATIAVLPAKLDVPDNVEVPELFDDYVLTAVQNAGSFRVIGQSDIDAMLGLERQKDLLGCDDAGCMADIGGALGVDYVITIAVARVEDEWLVATKLIDIGAARVEGRTSDFVAGGMSELLAELPQLLAGLVTGVGLSP